MTTRRPVTVKQLPERVGLRQAQELVRELEPFLKHDHPCVVFDFAGVRHLDSAGIEMLLRCMEEAMKRNGDIKLAAIPPPIAVILKLTRVDCLFEIFPNASDAVESYYRFPVHAFQQALERVRPSARAENNDPGTISSEGQEGR
jgi:anti-sigma B factor antagonist